jgi:hypothetical protein
MSHLRSRCIPFALTTLALLVAGAHAQPNPQAPAAHAKSTEQTRVELGKMWTFENPPLAYLEQEYGFAPTQEWLDLLRLASLRFGSWCSASFVSPKGLIMTNHHCMRDSITKAQPEDQDWVKSGFYATSYEEEVRVPGLTVQQLVAMQDVTGKMLEGVSDTDEEAAAQRNAENHRRILDEALEQHPGLEPEIVSLHQGAVFQLYLYKVYDDVRLVCAPHLQAAYFGGDPDNFTYPRYDLDFSFCRAYENGEPADTKDHYFRWGAGGAQEGDAVFVTGNPGSTGRLLTYAQMEYLRDAEYPIELQKLDKTLEVLHAAVVDNPENERRYRTIIFTQENTKKALTGYHAGLLDPDLMARKKAFEAEFRGKVHADPELDKKFGDVWDKLDEVCAQKTKLQPTLVFQTPNYSGHLARAVSIVLATSPDASEEQRTTATAMALGESVRSSDLRHALFVDHLENAVKWLGKSDPYVAAVVGDRTPEEAAERLAQSAVSDREFVKRLLDEGHEAVQASDDPAIAAARAIVPLMEANQQLAEKLDAQEQVQARRIGQALFACYGDKISPDATFTLRFSDGRVAGYPFNGTVAPAATSFYGMYARNAEFDNQPPFDLPEVWLQKRDFIDMKKPLDFVSTNDIIGGNSGSPVVDKDLRVVGLIFDGNIEQLPNRFLFRDRVERSVSVHVDAIVEALSKVYGADRIVHELLGE